MLNSLLVVLPVLAGVEAAGGDHYAQFRSKQELRPVKRSPAPAGGDHYAQFHNKGEFIAVRDHVEDGKRYFYPGDVIGFDERGLPITATTTIVVPMTTTQTIWVDPTGAPSSDSASAPLPTITGNETLPSSSSEANATSALPTSYPSGNETLPSPSGGNNTTSAFPTALPSGNETEPSPTSNVTTSVLPTTFPSGNETEPSTSSNATSALPTALPSGNDTLPSVSANQTSSALPTPLPSGNSTEPSPSNNATVLPSPLPSGNETEPSASANATSILPSPFPSGNDTEPSLSPNATSVVPTSVPSGNETESSTSGSASESLPTSSAESQTSSSASSSGTLSLSASYSSDASSTGTVSPSASITESLSSSASSTKDDWITSGSSLSSTWSSYTGESSSVEPSSSSSSSSYFSSTSSTSTWEEPMPTDSEPSALPTQSRSSSLGPTGSDYFSSTASRSSSELPPSSVSSSSPPKPTGSTGERIMSGYWADWTSDQLPPESVDWTKFDVVNYAFAEPDADGTLQFSQSNGGALLTRLTASAHAHGKRVVLSVGGWTGSAHFSTIMRTASGRSSFVKKCVAAYEKYNLDGIDLDWEYPGAPGASGNAVSPSDSANYLIFLQELRKAMPSPALITAATQVWPFYGSNGQPMSDVSEYAEIFDWILIMNYDIWGSSTEPGPNAPLSDGCNNSSQPTANAYAAVASWTAAGMPAHKIALGVAAYGYIQISDADHLYQRRSYPVSKRAVTIKNAEGGTSNGQINFASIVEQGALVRNGAGFTGAGGFVRYWDECSSTPWLKSEASGQVITYDDTQSLNLKGQFAAQAGLKGCSVWAMDGDLEGYPLISAVRSGMGI